MLYRSRPLAAAVAVVLSLSACGSSDTGSAADRTTSLDAGPPVRVSAAFYPLEFAVERIGGDRVEVTRLTPPGAEPHDLELSPRDVADLTKTSLVVYSRGFQPSVDAAITQSGSASLDVSTAADLSLAAPPEDPAHEGEGHEAEAEEQGGVDPHFWLDPVRYASVARAIATQLATIDPAGAATYEANVTSFTGDLDILDREFGAGTADCAITTLVTSHAAFGYLADRYGFTQVAIAGLSPEAEPSAAKLAQVSDLVRAQGVTTIYTETLVDPAFAETVAKTTGAALATLDPIEGLTDSSQGTDYFEVMRSNLSTLRTGQVCT